MASSIEYIVQDKIWIEDLGKNSEIGVSPAYLIVGARFLSACGNAQAGIEPE